MGAGVASQAGVTLRRGVGDPAADRTWASGGSGRAGEGPGGGPDWAAGRRSGGAGEGPGLGLGLRGGEGE